MASRLKLLNEILRADVSRFVSIRRKHTQYIKERLNADSLRYERSSPSPRPENLLTRDEEVDRHRVKNCILTGYVRLAQW